jgi:hypothetical protein
MCCAVRRPQDVPLLFKPGNLSSDQWFDTITVMFRSILGLTHAQEALAGDGKQLSQITGKNDGNSSQKFATIHS